MTRSKISVIIPVYNVEKYLEECLKSVITQDYRELEIICVNDCSTDNSALILEEYSGKDDRIKIITHEQNRGLGAARNTGIRAASGDYLFFLDSDDYLTPHCLEKLIAPACGADAVISKGEAFCADISEKERIVHLNEYLSRSMADNYTINKNNAAFMLDYMPSVAWGRLYNTKFIKDNEIFFIDDNTVHEDEGFFIKLIANFPKIRFTDTVSIMYRIRGGAITSNLNKNKKEKAVKKVVRDASAYIKNTKTPEVYKFFFNVLYNSSGYHKAFRSISNLIYDVIWNEVDKKVCIFTIPVYSKNIEKNKKRILGIPFKINNRKQSAKTALLKRICKLTKSDKAKGIKYIINNNDAFLEEILRSLEEFMFIPNKGNLGDALIAAAEFQYFEAGKFDYKIWQRTKMQTKPFNLVYGGGGIWHANYKKSFNEILDIFRSPLLKKCVILPSSFYDCSDVIEIFDERFTIFCREKQSYDYCILRNNRAKFIVADDMAVNMDFGIFKNKLYDTVILNEFLDGKQEFSYKNYSTILKKINKNLSSVKDFSIGYFLRKDAESTGNNNAGFDLSGLGGSYCLDSGFCFITSRLFLSVIDKFDTIVTDRLHIGIAAAKLGKKVYLLDNLYKKISSVYEYSLKNRFERAEMISDLSNIRHETSIKSVNQELPKNILEYIKEYGSIRNRHDFERRYL